MKVVHRVKLKHVQLTFALGDLFDAEVDAIVSSEQTDFVLSGNTESISGQIKSRYGYTIYKSYLMLRRAWFIAAGLARNVCR